MFSGVTNDAVNGSVSNCSLSYYISSKTFFKMITPIHRVLINGSVARLRVDSVLNTKDDGRGGVMFKTLGGKVFFAAFHQFSFVL